MSNYPPGVTGRECEIAGPDREYEATHRCHNCDADTSGMIQTYGCEAWFICSVCEETTEIDSFAEEQDAILEKFERRGCFE